MKSYLSLNLTSKTYGFGFLKEFFTGKTAVGAGFDFNEYRTGDLMVVGRGSGQLSSDGVAQLEFNN